MKKLLIITGSVLGLVIVAVAAVILYIVNFDPNENKEWIAEKFNEATGLTISFDGAIGLTFYPWLGVTLNGASISNAEGFSDNPLLQAQQADFRIKTMPLLRGRYEIDMVRLDGVHVNLEVAGNGENNWSSLSAQDTAAGQPPAGGGDNETMLGNIIIGGVDIRNTSVTYDDQSANTHYELADLNVQIGQLVYGEPLDIRMSLTALSRNPQLRSSVDFSGTVLYDVDNGLYQLDPLQMTATLEGPSVPGGATDITLATALRMNMEEDTLTLSDLQLAALDTDVNASLTASKVQTDAPSVNATLNVVGNDLSLLFRILELNELATRIRNLDNDFNIKARIDADMDTGDVVVPTLQASLLGADISGNLMARNANTAQPTVTGNLQAAGPDLPTLIEVLGILQQGRDSALAQTGRDLARVADKRFSLQTQFTADMEAGNIQLPSLNASMLGFQLTGALDATDMESGGSIDGNLRMTSSNLQEVLNALNQRDLADVAQSLELDVQLGGTGDNLVISPLKLALVVAGGPLGDAPQTLALNADTEVNLKNDRLEVDEFTLSGLGLDLHGSVTARNLSTDLAYEGKVNLPAFNVRQFLRQLNLAAPDTADAAVLQNVTVDADFAGTANSINLSAFDITLDDSSITGNVNISDLAVMSGSFNVNIDAIDADRYLAPAADTPEAAVSSAAPSPLPVDDLRALNLQGTLNIGELTISGLKMSSISVPLAAAEGMVTLNPVKATLYDGTFDGNIGLNVSGVEPGATVAATLAGINLAPLLQDFMDASYVTGNGNIELSLQGRGMDMAAIKRSLNGNGKVALEDGVFTGVDVGSTLAVVETMVRSRRLVNLPQGGETPFESFAATLNIDDGVVSTNDLLVKAPGWNLTGSGTLIDLESETIAFNMVAAVDEGTAKVEEEEYDIGGHTLPIACNGSMSSPRCLPDAKAIVASAVTNAVQDRIGAFLQDRLGDQQEAPAAETAPAEQAAPTDQPAAEPAPADRPAEEEKPVEEQLLNRALDRLLR